MIALKTDLKTTEIESRLIKFAVLTLKIAREIRKTHGQKSMSRQLIRASASAALNYGDTPYGGTSVDFVFAMNAVLKELHETHALLGIIRLQKYADTPSVDWAYEEAQQLTLMVSKSMEEVLTS